jgi:23S rRNA pseudouridine1911/1915/1917 synthase
VARKTIGILHQDDQIFVIDKPAGLLSAPERDGSGETILTQLTHQVSLDPKEQLRLVHRLDRDTSGVMIVARTREAQSHLTTQFMERTINKTYLAIVRGCPEEVSGQIHAPIAEKKAGQPRVQIHMSRGRPAATHWTLVERFVGFALLRCKPLTGRQHQIRIHMQLAGMPLAVDELYGSSEGILLSSFKANYKPNRNEEERPLISRLTLHAESIDFDHPSTGQRMRFEAPPPKDFRATLNQLRRHAAVGGSPAE